MKTQRILLWILLLVFCSFSFAQNRDIRNQREYFPHKDQLRVKYQYYYDFWSEQQVKHGRFSEWHPNGQLMTECTYVDDQLDGKYAEYFSDGKIKSTSEYKNGTLVGMRKLFRPNRSLKMAEEFDENGNLLRTIHYYPTGQKKRENFFRSGIEGTKVYDYRKNGDLKKKSRQLTMNSPEEKQVEDSQN